MARDYETRMNHESQAQFYEPAEVLSYLRREVEGSLGGRALTGIRVEGSLGRVPEGSRYAMIYGAELSGDDGSVIELAIPRRLEGVARSLEHKRVVVRGDLEPNVYRGRLNFRLEVRRICAASERGASSSHSGGAGTGREDVLSTLRDVRRRHRWFPAADTRYRMSIGVVHPRAGIVGQDFCRQLGKVEGLVDVEMIPVRIMEPEDVVRGLQEAKGRDIAVLIRGGGASGELAVLHDSGVIAAWSEMQGYTVCAIGHAEDRSLVELVSDAALDTPTAAGAFVSEKVAEANRRFGWPNGHEVSPGQHPRQAAGGSGSSGCVPWLVLITVVVVLIVVSQSWVVP